VIVASIGRCAVNCPPQLVRSLTASSAAKAFTGEGVAALAGEALQTHGGIGFTWQHDLHLYLRRATVNEVLYGSAAEHYERLVALRV
jgi:alkylation response protein AidB-like acyl-CoA dehydrogenase